MKRHQMNKLAMYRAVEALLTNTTETAEIAALPAKLTSFSQKLSELSSVVATQSQPLRASIAERDARLGAAINAAVAVAGIVLSYADAKKLGALAAKVRVKPSDFRGVRFAQRVQLAQQVHDAVVPVLPELADHGITAVTLQDLQTKLDAAAAAINAPRGTAVEKRAATERLSGVIREVDSMLQNQLDPLVLPLEQTRQEFYARYKAARSVVALGGRSAATLPPEASAALAPMTPAAAPPPAEKLAA